jgi:hypothetical protein
MAQKGELKTPVQPFDEALEHALDAIDRCSEGVAVFMLAGRVACTKRTSQSFDNNVQRLAGGLVGVYDAGADYRAVRADLQEFYKGGA